MTTDHRLQFTEAKNLALRVISTKTRHLFSFFFIFLYFILQPCEPFDKSSVLESIFVE